MNLWLHIVCSFIILLYIYFTYFMLIRIFTNKRYDKKLNINTRGIRSWGRNSLYHRTESTPYLALESFAKEYKFNETDRLVDFGAGKGRVSIYIHNKLNLNVTGVELNNLTYKDAIKNVNNYLYKYGHCKNVNLSIQLESAENYKIKKDDNKFFFFNPFNVVIFERVIDNIVENAIKNNKEVEIILYYPTKKYVNFLNTNNNFKLVKQIKTHGSIFPKEKISIYRFIP